MKRICLFICAVVITCSCIAQYKNDNVLFKTVYMQDLCNEINSNPGALFLDVRTAGEYADTSARGSNIGRFKNAVNIEVSELGKRIAELNAYKDKPVFIYCSHSQRSRRAGKMLADSGFTKLFNINGGMTGLRQFPVKENACMYAKLESNNGYDIISAADLCTKISRSSKHIFLLDVRTDSAFKHISLDAKTNAFGYFKNSVNIPLAELEANISKVPAGKEVIIIDLFGGDAGKAAQLLRKNNYPKVSVLLEGLDRLLYTNSKTLPCLPSAYVSNIPYRIINAQELKPFVENTKEFVFLDARTTEEFTNKHKNYWQNIGHLENAVNIPVADLETQWSKIESYKTKPVVIYVFSGGTAAHEAANILVKKGFTNVLVLQGGIFNIGWTAANIKGFESLAKLRVDIPVESL